MKNLYIVIALYASFVGCSSYAKKNMAAMPPQPIDPATEQQLIESARAIESSLNALAQNQQTKNPPALNTVPLITPEGGMGGYADIDWIGPIEPLIRKLADMTNYKVKVLGNEPPIPIIVSITQKKAIIADILKNASLQAGNKANIIVFPDHRIIEVRYNTK